MTADTDTGVLSPVTYQNIGVISGFQIVPRGSGQNVNIYNGDLTDVLLVSPDPTPSLSNSLPIQPLTNATIDGSKQQYASALSGVISQVTVGSASQLSPSPAQIAQQIQALGLATEATQQLVKTNTSDTHTAVVGVNTTLGTPSQDPTVAGLNTGIPNNIALTGVPLLTASTQLGTNGGFTITATNQRTFPAAGAFSVKQIGYELGISYSSTNGSVQNLVVTLTWSDSATGLVTAIDSFGVFPGSAGNPHIFRISGPTKGDQVTLNFNNSGTGFTATLQYILLQNSRYYSRDTIRTISSGSPAGQTLSNFNMPENVVAQIAANVNAHSQITRTIPMYAGWVSMTAFTTSGANDMEIALNDQGVNGNAIVDAFTNANGKLNIQFGMPRSGCLAVISNNNAAAITANVEIVVTPPDTL